MSEKPEALRLADWCDTFNTVQHDKAAAELRRLHEEVEHLHQINQSHEMKLSVRGYELQIEDLKAANQELLEALKRLHDATWLVSRGHYNEELHDIAVSKARAAIAKMEGQA